MMKGLKLPARPAKPRTTGLTLITDVGLSIPQVQAILGDYADYLDVAKFGVGSAYLTPRLEDKIAVYREFGVPVYFGGTLFEKFVHQKSLPTYIDEVKRHGITWVEVSNGTIELPLEERLAIVKELREEFNVLAEVGYKDNAKIMSNQKWIDEIGAMLEAGCKYVIAEGRDSGTAGMYRPNGELKKELVMDIIEHFDASRLIFEAPTQSSQMYFINRLGPQVNLGNVSPNDLLILECERVGLRCETFFSHEGR
jgi:phosphosulfolactate synthase